MGNISGVRVGRSGAQHEERLISGLSKLEHGLVTLKEEIVGLKLGESKKQKSTYLSSDPEWHLFNLGDYLLPEFNRMVAFLEEGTGCTLWGVGGRLWVRGVILGRTCSLDPGIE